jgi:branched-chain amino acid aminotransferase
VRANVASFTRHHPNVMMTKAKISGNYANSVLAKTESVRLGFDEAIMLDPFGFVAECTGENLFIVRDGALVTPTLASGALAGITRDSIMTIARDLGYEVREEQLLRHDLYLADEAFLTGTAAEVVPIRSVDDRVIGDPGEMTRKLQETYLAAVRGQVEQYKDWLEYA